MTQVPAAQFPRVARLQAQLDNLLVSRQPRLQLAIGDTSLAVVLQAGAEFRRDLPYYPLRAGAARLWLVVAPDMLARLGGPWLYGGPALDELPAALRMAALAAATGPLLDAIATQLGVAAVPQESGDDPPADAYVLSLAWEDSRLAQGLLYLDAPATTALCEALLALEPAAYSLDETALASRVTMVFAETVLSLAELQALAPGDIVLLPPATPPLGSALTLRLPDRAIAQARLEQRTLVVERLLETPMLDNDEPLAPGSPDDEPTTDDLEIRLEFDLGSLTIPLSELRQLGPESVLELEAIPDAQVRIRSGHQVIGTGELVQIDERLAVRVKSIFRSTRG